MGRLLNGDGWSPIEAVHILLFYISGEIASSVAILLVVNRQESVAPWVAVLVHCETVLAQPVNAYV